MMWWLLGVTFCWQQQGVATVSQSTPAEILSFSFIVSHGAGMTKNGKQETPEWLQKALGVEVPKVEGQGQTLESLLGPKPAGTE